MSESDDVKYPYLLPRDGRYSVRIRVPTDLSHLDKREHVVVALRTSDRREALSRYKQVVGTIERGFEQMRLQAASEDRVAAALRKGRLDLLDSADVEALARQWFEQRRGLAKAAVGTGDVTIQDERDGLAAELGDPEGSLETAQHATDRLLVAAGVLARPRTLGSRQTVMLFPVIDRATDQYGHLTRLVRRGLQMQADEARGSALLFPPAPFEVATPVSVGEPGRSVADLIAAYRADRIALKDKESTDRKYGHMFRTLEEALGPALPVAAIKRADCRGVREFLKTVTPDHTTLPVDPPSRKVGPYFFI
jgi:hypothetical protein